MVGFKNARGDFSIWSLIYPLQGRCLKAYDTSTYYAADETFNYEKIKLSQKTKDKLSNDDLDDLCSMEIM